MAVEVKHATQATVEDAGNGEIGKAEWNEGHTLTAAPDSLIATDGAGDAYELTLSAQFVIDSGLEVGIAEDADITIGGLHVDSTGAIELPAGSVAERPTPVAGMFRFNTDDEVFEGYNGSDWGEVGGGGTVATLEASGAITIGKPVALLSDGRVEQVADSGVPTSLGPEITYSNSAVNRQAAVYDSGSGRSVILYRHSAASNAGKITAVTLSGSTPSFSSPVTFSSNIAGVSAVYDSSANRVVAIWRDGTSPFGVKSTVIRPSGATYAVESTNTITLGNALPFAVAFDSTNNRIAACYEDVGAGEGRIAIGTVSGTSVSWGSPVAFATGGVNGDVGIAFDASQGKVIVAYSDAGSTNDGTVKVGTISGSSVTFGSGAVFDSGSITDCWCVYDSDEEHVVVLYSNGSSGRSVVVSVAGTTPSFSSPVTFESGVPGEIRAEYDSTAKKIVAVYLDSSAIQKATFAIGELSGTTITWDSPVVLDSGICGFPRAAFYASEGKTVVSYNDVSDSNRGNTRVITARATFTNAPDFVGFAQQTVADGEEVDVSTAYGIDVNQSGLTPMTTYYVDLDGTLSASDTGYPVAGYALTATILRVGA